MDILILGGTRLVGKHLVCKLMHNGHNVTIATRGRTPDSFGGSVNRITLERTDAGSIETALKGRHFDIVCDSLAYCSNDVKLLLDIVECDKYVMTSTVSVYPKLNPGLTEEDFDALSYPLKWCGREDFDYGEIKRQAECALFQAYPHMPSAAVRIPYVIGEDDYTRRLYFYAEHVAKGIPMHVNNLDKGLAFIRSDEAGQFIAHIAESDICRAINGASIGNINLAKIIGYIEERTNKKAVFSPDADPAPYNWADEFSLDTGKAEKTGFKFSHIEDWIYELLDELIKALV